MPIQTKSFEIFCGTGGVGKTTLATSRALAQASQNLRVLLITIDPARRLKDLLGLKDSGVGDVTPVEVNGIKLDALLMSPEKTIRRMAEKHGTPDLAANRIVQILGIINKVLSTGLKKLLGYLEGVTDAKFIQDFVQAVQIIYQSKDAFLKGLSLQDRLKSRTECNWFLVTSVEQGKAQEAIEMKAHATHFIHQDHFLVLNKCLEDEMKSWNPEKYELKLLKESLENREVNLKQSLRSNFPVVLEFPEVMSLEPLEHVNFLTKKWNSYVS